MEKENQNLNRKYIRTVILILAAVSLIFLESSYNAGIIGFSPSGFLLKTFSANAVDNESTLVRFVNVGQGDCTIIKLKDKCVVIDFGPEDDTKTIYKNLKELRVEDVDLAVVTHLHKDHFGGFLNLPKFINVKNIIVNNSGAEDADELLAKEFFEIVEKYNIEKVEPYVGMRYYLSEAFLEILYMDKKSEKENNRSLFIMVEIDGKTITFTGDGEKEAEEGFLKAYPKYKTNVLKLGHHGSSTSTNENFIKQLKPLVTVASCGYNNYYNHPSDKTVSRLYNEGIKYYRTDLDGNITLTFEANKIIAATERRQKK